MKPKQQQKLQTLLAQGNLTEARALCLKACKTDPRDVQARSQLGIIHVQMNELDAAIECFRQNTRITPDDPAAWFNLSKAVAMAGNMDEAVTHCRRTVQLNPRFVEAHINLAEALLSRGEADEAETHARKAADLAPSSAVGWFLLGTVQQQRGRGEEAAVSLRRAIELQSDHADARLRLALLLKGLGRPFEAIEHLQWLIDHRPELAEPHVHLGMIYEDLGRAAEAVPCFEKFLALRPDRPGGYSNLSNLLFLLAYNVLRTPGETLEAHRAWDRIHGGEDRARTFTHRAWDGGDRKLRVGYVSPDFQNHPVNYFFEPVLAAHDRARVEVYCYAEVSEPDAVTARLEALADGWRNTVGLTDEAVARQIHEDGIDVLVDLAGHTANSRLRVFTYKPAPVQATYLGYFCSTGLAAMDYWISDEVLHPADTVERATEEIYRLPRCCLVYAAPADCPAVAARDPSSGHVTFGSFNDLTKVSPDAVALWSRTLLALPGSRMLIKARQLGDPATREDLVRRFAEHDIDSARLTLRGRTSTYREHMEDYGEVDIALDTVPRTGGSTTAEALWMGVPVVTLAGERFIGRLSATMLNAIGLDELVATGPDDFIARAEALARDPERLRSLRDTMRDRMQASPLCDAQGLARALEDAYLDMRLR